jgi:hypothetical protein
VRLSHRTALQTNDSRPTALDNFPIFSPSISLLTRTRQFFFNLAKSFFETFGISCAIPGITIAQFILSPAGRKKRREQWQRKKKKQRP